MFFRGKKRQAQTTTETKKETIVVVIIVGVMAMFAFASSEELTQSTAQQLNWPEAQNTLIVLPSTLPFPLPPPPRPSFPNDPRSSFRPSLCLLPQSTPCLIFICFPELSASVRRNLGFHLHLHKSAEYLHYKGSHRHKHKYTQGHTHTHTRKHTQTHAQ